MTVPARFHDPQGMVQIAEFFAGLKDLYARFEGPYGDNEDHPYYTFSTEIVIRHKDQYTIGRIGMEDDFLFFEITDENYGEPAGSKP